MVNLWELPEDIIGHIVKFLSSVEDIVRFGAVCKSWSCLADHHHRKVSSKSSFSPWLMLAKLENDVADDEQGTVRSCYSLVSSSSSKLFNLTLPELRGRRCWGTPYGWLFTIGLDKRLFLFHPFTRTKLFLPYQRRFKDKQLVFDGRLHICLSFIRKVVLSSNPSHSSSSTVALVIYGGGNRLAFASPGDKSWTPINTKVGASEVIFFKGNVYHLDRDGVLWFCNINHPHQIAQPIGSPSSPLQCICSSPGAYLVEISGNLYFIRRSRETRDGGLYSPISDMHTQTQEFYAFVFDFHNKQWMPGVEDFNGHALFLGNNTSFAVPACDYPELRPDCIYFTDDLWHLYSTEEGYYNDMGVYDFKNKTLLEPFYEIDELASKFSRPFFFIPSLA